MINGISTYLKYADLQMAAESLFGMTGSTMDVGSLMLGNNRSSKFTEIQARLFLNEGWTVAEHESNTGTGFSGTLFRNSKTGEQVLSFRSTEFADDAARDNQATNVMEIKAEGWAFGQIADMEKWFSELEANGKLDPGATLTVTGYSLGGHLATAFNLLHANDLTSFGAPLVGGTYTFNGAGVGTVSAGHTLADVMQTFGDIRSNGAVGLFTSSPAQSRYTQMRSQLNGTPTRVELADAISTLTTDISTQAGLSSGAQQPNALAELDLLRSALSRAKLVLEERDRVASLPNSGGTPPLATSANAIDAIKLDYQIAVLVARTHTEFGATWIIKLELGPARHGHDYIDINALRCIRACTAQTQQQSRSAAPFGGLHHA